MRPLKCTLGSSVRRLIALSTGLLAPLVFAQPWWAAAVGTVAVLAYRRSQFARLFFLGCLLGVFHAEAFLAERLPTSCERREVHIAGEIADFPVIRQGMTGGRQQQFLLFADAPIANCGSGRWLLVTLTNSETSLRLGDRLRLVARLKPIVTRLNPNQIPLQARFAAVGIAARASSVELIAHSPASIDSSRAVISRMRSLLASKIATLDSGLRAKGLLQALVVGNGGAVLPEDWTLAKYLGLAHVLVISGLHVGLVYGLVALLAQRATCFIGSSGTFTLSAAPLAGLLAATGYTLLAGASVPTVRALLLLLLLRLPRLLHWRTGNLYALAFTAVIVLVFNPFAVLASSFWMTVTTTGLLMVLARSGQQSHSLWGLLKLQLTLMLLGAPLSLFWFGGTSGAAWLSNLLIVPPLALLVVPLALLGAVAVPFDESLAESLWWIAAGFIDVLLMIMDRINPEALALSYWQLHLGFDALRSLVIMCALLAAFRWLRKFGWRWQLLTLGLLLWLLHDWQRRPLGELAVLDVGQGLAVVYRDHDRTLLYDTGLGQAGRFSLVPSTIAPFIDPVGRQTLDTLVVSHSDIDHAGGLQDVVTELTPRQHLGFGGDACRSGAMWDWPGGTRFTILNSGPGNVSNDDSCVLRIDVAGIRFLLLGDIHRERERDLVRYWRQELAADVVVVAHHGSATSSSWTALKWIKPRVAVISAGKANRFGHPAEEVSGRLQQLAPQVLNTAEVGAIRFLVTAGGELVVRPSRTAYSPFWLQVDDS